MHLADVGVQAPQLLKYTAAVHTREQRYAFSLRMNSLNMGVQVPFLGEGSRAEHAEVRFLPRVSHHVSLQHHLLVKSLAAM